MELTIVLDEGKQGPVSHHDFTYRFRPNVLGVEAVLVQPEEIFDCRYSGPLPVAEPMFPIRSCSTSGFPTEHFPVCDIGAFAVNIEPVI